MCKSFLQSEQWISLKRSEGKKYLQIANSWWEERVVPFVGVYWYGPHVYLDSVEELLQHAKQNGVVFLRIDAVDKQTYQLFKDAGVDMHNVREEQPATSLILDLEKTEEELLTGMKSKTRYNIRVAQKHELETEIIEGVLSEELFEAVWGLFAETAQRHGIRQHEKAHYKKLNASGMGLWVLTSKDGKLLSAHFCIGHEQRLVYLYGSSSSTDKYLMSPYITQWRTIQWAKEHGYKEYDFWGIAPWKEDATSQKLSLENFQTNHRFSGVTRFKIGFGGVAVTYPSTAEVVIRPGKYFWYRILKRMRSLTKGGLL